MTRPAVLTVAAGVAATLLLGLAACSGASEERVAPPTTSPATTSQPNAPADDPATTRPPAPQNLTVDLQRMDEVGLPEFPPGARYVLTLCALDVTSAMAAADPGAALLALFDTVPTDDPIQAAELASIRDGFAAGLASSNPVRSPELLQAANLVGMRCG